MEKIDLINLYVEQGKTIDELWNMFLFVHLTFIGGIYFADRQSDRGSAEKHTNDIPERILFLLGYVLFIYINYGAKYDAYTFIMAIVDDINVAKLDRNDMVNISKYFSFHGYENSVTLLTLAHLIGFFVVAILLFKPYFKRGRRKVAL